jgi:hypothetical protein
MSNKKDGTKPAEYEQEIEELINSIIKMSSLAKGMSTAREQEQMQGKKATFVIKGIDKRYIFEVIGTEVKRTENPADVTTYCYCKSPQIFLETVDRIIDGDVSAFQRALQRGDLILKGSQSFHDQLMWKKGLDRLSSLRKVYGTIQ